MKVLFLANLPSPYRAMFFCELGKLCDLTVIYERRSASDRNEKWVAHTEKTYREIYLDGKPLGTDNSLSFAIRSYLKKETYDHCVIGMYSTGTAMVAISYLRLHKIPFIINTDGGFIKQENRLKRTLKRSLMSSASAWLSTGKMATDYLTYYGAKAGRIYQYPFTSVSRAEILNQPLSALEKERLRRKLGMTGQKIAISVGQFIPRKGYDVLMRALPLLRTEAELYIVGGTKQQFEALVGSTLPEHVHSIDFLEREELFDYYHASDLFILPTREDVWGLVVNEAMACGLPVITTERCGAGAELVQDGINGYLVPVENVGALADKMELLFSSDYAEMGKRSLELIEKYTFESMAQKHLQILEQIH